MQRKSSKSQKVARKCFRVKFIVNFIQSVGESELAYQDVYYAWPQLTDEQWTAHGFPPMEEDQTGMYASLVHIIGGDWAGSKGIYLRPHPDKLVHQIALAGPASGGSFRILEVSINHFLIKAMHPSIRGGVMVSYDRALDLLEERRTT